jgi:hypothetical protein
VKKLIAGEKFMAKQEKSSALFMILAKVKAERTAAIEFEVGCQSHTKCPN